MNNTDMGSKDGDCKSVCPIMPTTDIERTVQFYKTMGFEVEVYGDFVMARRDAIELFFSLKPDHDPARTAACVYVRVEEADALHARWQAEELKSLRALRNTDYKMREFAVIDPDGNMMLYGSPLSGE